jgi:hypothetical protein
MYVHIYIQYEQRTKYNRQTKLIVNVKNVVPTFLVIFSAETETPFEALVLPLDGLGEIVGAYCRLYL